MCGVSIPGGGSLPEGEGPKMEGEDVVKKEKYCILNGSVCGGICFGEKLLFGQIAQKFMEKKPQTPTRQSFGFVLPSSWGI